jgi:dipeptidyl aminopeptidase/acylaminoacyl peptidase
VATRTPTKQALPYGSWPTPVTSAAVVAAAVGLSDARVDGDDVIWSESRPSEDGRTQLVRAASDGARHDLLAEGRNARTAVHEYGGGAWWVRDGVIWFSDWQDQRLHRRDPQTERTQALTPEPEAPRGDRYADGDLTPDGRWIACVREHHPRDSRGAVDVRNEIVRLAAHQPSTPQVLVSGPDFVSSPRWSPDGKRLCWVEWDHPNMPWDATRLKVRDLDSGDETLVAGGLRESVGAPDWQTDGSLMFISDRTGWSNLYRWSPFGRVVEPVVQVAGEIGEPQWVLEGSRYGVLADGRVVFACWREGYERLGIRLSDGTIAELDTPFSSIYTVRVAGPTSVIVIAATPTAEAAVARVELADGDTVSNIATLRAPRDLGELGIGPEHVSVAEPIEFPSDLGRGAYGLFYPPVNPDFGGRDGELPPLLVYVHGGPTGAATAQLRIGVQYWTTRGFAVVEVNYGGSTGYGRAYRELLNGCWGIVDVVDCIAAAQWLAREGRVSPERLCIRGGSAGGFTTLAGLAREDTPFAAGGDHFGVADLEALAKDTHKFESRYLDRLVGPYPEARDIYSERSPINHTDVFARPLIVLQGLEDPVVPSNQAEMIVAALREKGVPVAYLAFEGEQHGFRKAENIRRALDAELSFYAQVFGFELPEAEGIEPVEVENLGR